MKSVEGITVETLDRMGALGMISVFDIEEVGVSVLTDELEMSEELALAVVDACGKRAHEITEEQAKEKEEQERLAAENGESVDDAAADAILGGVAVDEEADDAADSILGGSVSDSEAQSAADSILGGGSAESESSESAQKDDDTQQPTG